MQAGAGRRRVRGEGPQARPRRRRPGEGRRRRPCVRAGPQAAPSPQGPRRRCRRRGRRGGSPAGHLATRSTPCVPRAAQAGMPHPARASQSKTPSATTAQEAQGPRRPSPSTGLGPGSAWNRGVRSGSTARPTSQRTRPPEASGTTTIPAKRSAPRSMNSPQSWSRSAEKPHRLKGLPQPAARRIAEAKAGCGDKGRRPARPGTPRRRGCAGADRRRTAPPPSAGRGL